MISVIFDEEISKIRAKKNARERFWLLFTARLRSCARERERERASHASNNDKAAFSLLCSDALFFERVRFECTFWRAISLSLVHLFF
jgi:hypothetical protein